MVPKELRNALQVHTILQPKLKLKQIAYHVYLAIIALEVTYHSQLLSVKLVTIAHLVQQFQNNKPPLQVISH